MTKVNFWGYIIQDDLEVARAVEAPSESRIPWCRKAFAFWVSKVAGALVVVERERGLWKTFKNGSKAMCGYQL